MSLQTQSTNAPYYVSVTIPDNTGIGATIQSLIDTALSGLDITQKAYKYVTIEGYIPGAAGTQRAAIVVASKRIGATAVVAGDYTTHGKYIAAGAAFTEISDATSSLSVRSSTSSAVTALLKLL